MCESDSPEPPFRCYVFLTPLLFTPPSSFSGAINYGLGSAGGSLAPWKTMFLFAGAVTMAWGVVVVLLLPESPARPGRFFNPDERRILLDRVRRNQTGLNRKPFQWWQVREALQDPAIYFYLLLGSSIYVRVSGVSFLTFGCSLADSKCRRCYIVPGRQRRRNCLWCQDRF